MNVSDKNFEKEVLKSEIPVLIEFWASWCTPCKIMEYILNELEKEYDNRILIAKMNVDRNRTIPVKYNISGMPTFIVFKEGKIFDTKIGAQSKKDLIKMIKKVL